MRIAECWQRLQGQLCRRRARQQPRRRLLLECLEARTVPTLLWSSAGTRSVVDGGGPVLTHVDVDLVFWGAGWNNAQPLMNNVVNGMTTLLNGPYLSLLSQYRGIGSGQLLRTDLITSTNPASQTRDTQYSTFIRTNLNNGTLPVTPNTDSQILYLVVPQPGTRDSAESALGAHNDGLSNVGRYYYGWSENVSNLDDITSNLSHELVEAVTDPVPFTGFHVPSTRDEISDGEAENYNYRVDGVLVQSILSQKDHAYVVYDNTSQAFVLSRSGVLTVNGDQLTDPNDTITIDQVNNGYKVTLNGEVAQFEARDYFTQQLPVSSITINTGTGDDTANVEKTVAGLLSGLPVTVNLGDGTDTVNLSPEAQTLKNLPGAVTVNGGSGSGTRHLFDQGSSANQNYTVTNSTIARPSMATFTYHNLANLTLNTSNGTDTVTVQNTAANTATTITGGTGATTLVGSAAANTWDVTGSNAGTLSSSTVAGTVTFTSVQNLTGGAADNTFVFSDDAGISGNLQGGGNGTLDYSAYSSDVSVNLQSGTATGVSGTVSGIQAVAGGGGNNTLVGANVSNVWNLTGTNTGTVSGAGTVAFTGFQNLMGGAATNAFVFRDGAGVSGALDGGGQGSLDYAAYSSSVIVDLQTGTATGVGSTVAHIQNVTGGNGGGAGVYNILVGNGANLLTGGNGRRNLLIAGSSASTLLGGDDDDVLVGGTTAYDLDVASLTAIMDYWSGTLDDYGTRVDTLMAGKGVPRLDATTVVSNGGSNSLTGGAGVNLYYGTGSDTTDFDPNSGAVFVPV